MYPSQLLGLTSPYNEFRLYSPLQVDTRIGPSVVAKPYLPPSTTDFNPDDFLNIPSHEMSPAPGDDDEVKILEPYFKTGLRAMEEGDGRLAVWDDGTPMYESLRDSSMAGPRDVTFDGYFGDPPLTDVGIDPAVLARAVSSRKRKRTVRNVSRAHTCGSDSPRAGVRRSRGRPAQFV